MLAESMGSWYGNATIALPLNNLTQWIDMVTLDFVGNQQRILRSISTAQKAGAKLRVGPELEVGGPTCMHGKH
jgi:NAD+ synthase (glutamine-hydrolysing)